jgi:hypothetical protein
MHTNAAKPTHPDLICSTGLREITDPLDAVIVALLEHLQESDNQAGSREHEHLEVNINWWSGRPSLGSDPIEAFGQAIGRSPSRAS